MWLWVVILDTGTIKNTEQKRTKNKQSISNPTTDANGNPEGKRERIPQNLEKWPKVFKSEGHYILNIALETLNEPETQET